MMAFIALFIGLVTSVSLAEPLPTSAEANALQGVRLTPANETGLGISVFLDTIGCEAEGEWRVEIQHPVVRLDDPAMMAELRWEGSGDASLTAQLFQKRVGSMLITDFCIAPGLLTAAKVTLWYGGYGRSSNVFVTDLQRWRVD